MIYIGIDPGTHTGMAIWDSRKGAFLSLETTSIHRALIAVFHIHFSELGDGREGVKLVFEDARQRKWFGEGDISAKQQGAGSVKRDCSIWEDFCNDYDIPFEARPPIKGATKVTAEYFKMISHYQGRTSSHSRDAAMLVIGR